MKYAVLSDIHANLEALTAVLEDVSSQRIDRVVNLGDSVGYGADPVACLRRLEEAKAIGVCGNHEWGCVGKLDLRWFNEAARRALEWTKDQLSFTDLNALRQLPLTSTDGPLTLVHGTLIHPGRFEYLIEVGQGLDCARACQTLICCVGHTHVPCVLEVDWRRRQMNRLLTVPQELAAVRLTNDAQEVHYVINPGSVGQPRDGDPRAGYAMVDTDEGHVGIRRVPYDIARAQAKIRQAGLPGFLADRLTIGR
jgi:predicted phosphodiesterase